MQKNFFSSFLIMSRRWFFYLFIYLFSKRNQAQEGCSERPIGHLMSAAPNRIKTCTGKYVAMAYKR